MGITLHAVALLAIPALTVTALCLLKLSPPTPRRLLYGMIPCLFVLLATAGCNHLCREGQDSFQWLIPVPCLYLVLLSVHSGRWRALLASGIAFACLALSWHFDSVVTGLFPYVGVPQDFWYPGGPLSEAASRIELRDRLHDASVLDMPVVLANPQP